MGLGARIENEIASAVSGTAFEQVSPVNGEVASATTAGKTAEVVRAAPSAVAEVSTCATTDPSQRRDIPDSCADILEARNREFVALLAGESGGGGPCFGFSVLPSANNMLREAAAMATRITGGFVHFDTPDTLATGFPQPVGVLVGTVSWNAPILPWTK